MALRFPFPALISRSRPLDFIPLYPPFATSFSSISALRSRGVRLLRRYRYVTVSSLKQEQEEKKAGEASDTRSEWGKVSAVLFDMDGVLCNSEDLSRQAGVDVFAEMGVSVTAEDFVPFMGTGEANFLGGVASVKGVENFNPEAAKKRFFEIYLDKYAKPESGIGFPGAYELIMQCKRNGLKVAVASSADRIKVDANLAAAGLPLSIFDAIVSADAFENLKPAPDIFIAASKCLNVPPSECLVIEDALAGVQAARAAQMRCIAVTTTLSMGALQEAGPSLIRKDIGNVSLHDILSGSDSGSHNERMQGSQNSSYSVTSSLEPVDEGIGGQSKPDVLLRGAWVAEIIYRQVAGFSARYCEIWKFGHCSLMSCFCYYQ
ncbi:NHL repeat-containing protein 2 isoform X1 [Cinnamomum micranthum f. kanehirae]|uniref:NHL repeat-containing protein 2 isoform X1 n=1 Tax=Cinnamomum micranthum f. kanehirae TaxID=337451 RepID=A0A443ND40_9MAGN|nr:NHL repeat-containing protein 2 isoform X1 [Cinnamomum micranthum f. kanehirae]